MEYYDNLVDAINALKDQGYSEDFNLKQNCIECRDGAYQILHNEFEIDKFFRFEGDDTDPEDQSILYAVSSSKYDLKGILINGYGIYTEDIADEMLEKLNFSHH